MERLIDQGTDPARIRYAQDVLPAHAVTRYSLSDADLQRILAAIMELDVFQWASAKMHELEAGNRPAAEPAPQAQDMTPTQYRRLEQTAEKYARAGVHKSFDELQAEIMPAASRQKPLLERIAAEAE